MITIKSVSYTSLKDLMPSSSSSSPPSTAAIASPKVRNSSRHEIPIKNPLVKQAALAYLQPVGSPPVACEKGLFEKVKERCCGECGCVSWLYDVVWRKVKESFSDRRDDVVDDYYDEDDDKVD
ncbi:pentatricopeptide repeat-containing protein [Hibiscus syriacus]|uniref:Pentatricopeptide repeat-containing protein n=1 Tax=Hibiscus syriacus TaxID=106335 RepID=A0A6A2XBE4_HIBSY|nr:pentatricopeptide repeat-containing protein [Hibiscus syriacus]